MSIRWSAVGAKLFFPAIWSDGDVSDAAKFDVCEKDLVIEFTR